MQGVAAVPCAAQAGVFVGAAQVVHPHVGFAKVALSQVAAVVVGVGGQVGSAAVHRLLVEHRLVHELLRKRKKKSEYAHELSYMVTKEEEGEDKKKFWDGHRNKLKKDKTNKHTANKKSASTIYVYKRVAYVIKKPCLIAYNV